LSVNNTKNEKNNGTPETEKNILEPKYEYLLYFSLFVFYYVGSLILPVLIGTFFLKELFVDEFLNFGGIRDWNSYFDPVLYPIENSLEFFNVIKYAIPFAIFLISPLILIGLYLLRQFCSACIVKFYYYIFNVIQQRRELKNVTLQEYRDINIYHTRSFILRIIKWQFSKGPFPWLTNWMFNFIKSNKIGKDAVIEDGFLCSEYLEMKENSYVGQSTIVSSQTIEGKYGALTIRKVKIGENSVVGPFSVIAPGVEMDDNALALPFSGCTKNFKMKQNRIYWGRPATLIRRKKFEEFIQLPQKLRKKKEKLKGKISEKKKLPQKEE
jgi:acetyltransferase-like isoleucine patch superfamily enzyme